MPGAETSTVVYVPAICLGVSCESCLMRAVPFDGELPMFFSSCLKSSLLVHPLCEFDANNRHWFHCYAGRFVRSGTGQRSATVAQTSIRGLATARTCVSSQACLGLSAVVGRYTGPRAL